MRVRRWRAAFPVCPWERRGPAGISSASRRRAKAWNTDFPWWTAKPTASYPHTRPVEQLPHHHAGVARGRRGVRPADDDLERSGDAAGLPARGEGTEHRRDVVRRHTLTGKVFETLGKRPGMGAGDVALQRQHAQWRFQQAGFQKCRESGQIVPVERGQGGEVHHGPRVGESKNAASVTPTVGTTSARSRKSLRCSQLVSEISRQP